MVSNEVPHHMHVTCGTEVHKPPIRNLLKCVIGRLTDVKKGLCAHIVLDRLCVLYAGEVTTGAPLWDINFYIGPIKCRLDQILFLAKDGGAVSCVFIQEFPSSVAFNCNKNEWFMRVKLPVDQATISCVCFKEPPHYNRASSNLAKA